MPDRLAEWYMQSRWCFLSPSSKWLRKNNVECNVLLFFLLLFMCKTGLKHLFYQKHLEQILTICKSLRTTITKIYLQLPPKVIMVPHDELVPLAFFDDGVSPDMKQFNSISRTGVYQRRPWQASSQQNIISIVWLASKISLAEIFHISFFCDV